ncbi:MAG TPA: hypothetical protein VGD18_01340, partial [Thiobacillaceae bacterium]
MSDYRAEFVEFAVASNVLCFGEFKTKAGRMSPYFFNAGLFNDGDKLKRLGEFYAKAIVDSGIAFDVLFGPAYKGIPLAASIAIALAGMGKMGERTGAFTRTLDIVTPLPGLVLNVARSWGWVDLRA